MESDLFMKALAEPTKSINDAVWKGFFDGVAFAIGDRVRKRSGAQWEGLVVGYYSTKQTHKGVCVESIIHKGSVQIYPDHALELIKASMDLPR